MNEREQRPFGRWDSPLSGESMAGALRFEDLAWRKDGSRLVWAESRAGINTLVEQAVDAHGGLDDAPRDLTSDVNSRGQVSYGGGAFSVAKEALFYCCDEGLFRLPLDHGGPRAMVPHHGAVAAPTSSPDGRWLLYVHHASGEDSLVLVDGEGERWPQRLARGADFYMQPAWHPDNQRVAWVEWDHPNMPWDGSRLVLAELRMVDGVCVGKTAEVIAGDRATSVFQPTFSPDGRRLAYASDASGRGQLYIYDLVAGEARQLTDLPGELDQPAWAQGMRSFAFDNEGQRLLAIENRNARARLWTIDIDSGRCEVLPGLESYTALAQPAPRPGSDDIALIAASTQLPPRIVCCHDGRARVLRRSTSERLAPGDLASAEVVSFSIPEKDRTSASESSVDDGEVEAIETLHGLLYRPQSRRFEDEGQPPALISLHGGPTGQAHLTHSLRAQYFATRGFMVLELNYRGSCGYGRAYRRALDGAWGVSDVADTVAARDYLANTGLADPRRIAVIGGSAGGYTVLRCLCEHPGVFVAGLSLYGISNLLTLAASTHKFESRYLDRLVGPLPAAIERYRERSPIHAADRIADPVAIFQGSEDKVVPPDQAEAIVASLRQRGVPHRYHLYQGEGHGWRSPQTIRIFWEHVDAFINEHVL